MPVRLPWSETRPFTFSRAYAPLVLVVMNRLRDGNGPRCRCYSNGMLKEQSLRPTYQPFRQHLPNTTAVGITGNHGPVPA
jgi:hypothetical protein